MKTIDAIKSAAGLHKAAFDQQYFNGHDPLGGGGAYDNQASIMPPAAAYNTQNGIYGGQPYQNVPGSPGKALAATQPEATKPADTGPYTGFDKATNRFSGALAVANPMTMPLQLGLGLLGQTAGAMYRNKLVPWSDVQKTHNAIKFKPNNNLLQTGGNIAEVVGYAASNPIDGARIAWSEIQKGQAARNNRFNPQQAPKPIAQTTPKPVQNTVPAKPLGKLTGATANPYMK